MKNFSIAILGTLLILTFCLAASAQQPAQADMTVDAATKAAVINTLIKEMNDGYIFPETAATMEADLRARQGNKEYDSITSAKSFADKLTSDVQSISKDKHLRVRYSADPIPVRTHRDEPTAEEKANFALFNKMANYGFVKVEILQGNLGYVDLRGFNDPEAGAETVRAAMNFLANADALIFDLRQNGGGDPRMIALISSYLFGDKPVHLNDMYFREGNRTEEFWTKPEAANKKMGDKDIYVLTSNRTFSGAEEFSNNIKVLKRGTIIGETTGGGANPGGSVRLNEHFSSFIPVGRAINPITKTNWEGVGVEPDIKTPKELALKTAQLIALKRSAAAQKNNDIRSRLNMLIEDTQKELDSMTAKK